MKKTKIIKTDLSRLVKKYAESDVIHTIEREYKTSPLTYISTMTIDDSVYLSKIKPTDRDITPITQALINNEQVEPVVIRPKKDHFEIVIGRKRLYAARKAGINKIPALIRNYTDEETLLVLLTVAREEHRVNQIEIALICRSLSKEYGYTQMALASLTHQSRPQITNIMRLLSLPDSIVRDVAKGRLSYGHARAICALPEAAILEVVQRIYKENLTVRAVEDIVSLYRGKQIDPRFLSIENKYDVRVTKRKNKLIFDFDDDNQLDEIIKKLMK